MPVTFPTTDTPQTPDGAPQFSPAQWPGLIEGDASKPLPVPCTGFGIPFATCEPGSIVEYSEGLLVGYRWYQQHGVAPAFCFGHGLGYAQFEYREHAMAENGHLRSLLVTRLSTGAGADDVSLRVRFTVTNTGSVPAAEIPQLYLGFPAEAGEPPKQLKGFRKTKVLDPRGSEVLTLDLTPRDVSIWDTELGRFRVVRGEFTAFVGASSCDIRLTGTATL